MEIPIRVRPSRWELESARPPAHVARERRERVNKLRIPVSTKVEDLNMRTRYLRKVPWSGPDAIRRAYWAKLRRLSSVAIYAWRMVSIACASHLGLLIRPHRSMRKRVNSVENQLSCLVLQV